jgi:predicted ArsR family transcriptional regulator
MTTIVRSTSPIARRRDPATSHQAARELTRSGERTRQIDAVLDALRTWRGPAWPTSAELAAAIRTLDRYQVARRLADLEHRGLVRKEAIRACGITGRAAVTWVVAEPGARQEPLF